MVPRQSARIAKCDVKPAPEQNLAVRLYRYAQDSTVHIRIKARIQCAIRRHPRDVSARCSSHRSEVAPEQNLAVRLYRYARDSADRTRIKARI